MISYVHMYYCILFGDLLKNVIDNVSKLTVHSVASVYEIMKIYSYIRTCSITKWHTFDLVILTIPANNVNLKLPHIIMVAKC